MHSWLKDLGIRINKNALISWKGDKLYYKKQRHKYGFDEREIYNLDITTAYWLYEHLKMLYKVSHNIVDWSYHKQVVPVLKGYDINKRTAIWEDNELDMQDIILLMIHYLKEYITYNPDYKSELTTKFEKVNDTYTTIKWYKGDREATDEEVHEEVLSTLREDELNNAKLQTALKIYAQVIHFMWY